MNSSTQKNKEIDLRVAQEIKNNKDFIYQTNQSLQNLSQNLIASSLQNEKNRALLAKEIKDLAIEFENLQNYVNNCCSQLRSMVGDNNSNFTKLANAVREKITEIHSDFATLDDVSHYVIDNEKGIEDLKKELKIHSASHDSSLFILKGQIQGQIDDLKALLLKPEEGPTPYILRLESKIKEDAVTRDGLVKEIELLKKKVIYNEKQFEYLVNQIKRLKGEKE